jgi:two-component system sensor histidine kinase KdpD
LKGYGLALLISLGVTLVAIPLLPYLDHANLVMLFLLAVVGVAAGYGRGPAVLVAVLNVLSFNFVFVPPTFAFAFDTLQAIPDLHRHADRRFGRRPIDRSLSLPGPHRPRP